MTFQRLWNLVWLALFVLLVFFTGSLWHARFAHAHDQGHPEWSEWFEHLKMPDNPTVSCCGEADSYWADSYEIKKDPAGITRYYAIITDERPDCCYGRTIMGNGLTRRHIPVGTPILIPDRKIVDATKQQNPTGHGIVFIGPGVGNENIYCYLPPGGV